MFGVDADGLRLAFTDRKGSGLVSVNATRVTVVAAFVLVAAACADNTADTTEPVVSAVTAPSATTVTSDAGAGDDETTDGDTPDAEAIETPPNRDRTTTEVTDADEETTGGDTTATEATETLDETTDGDPTTTTTETPDETTDGDPTTIEAGEEAAGSDTTGEEEVAAEPVGGETSDVSSASQPDAQNQPVELPEPDRVVVWEGVGSEDRCVVAGGVWTDSGCEYWVFADPADAGVESYWHPSLINDAYNAVDPAAVEADHYESLDTRGPWGIHNYHVFYHYNNLGDSQVQYEAMRQARSYAVRSVFTYITEWVWFPYRYDVSWSDTPNIIAITGTYPLGEQRILLLHADPEQRSVRPNIETPLPLPPPIRPTTPFAETPLHDSGAEKLGRDCPPVEEVWGGFGTEVTDPCTLQAVETAVDWMWRGNVEQRQWAIRDGRSLAAFLQEIEDTSGIEGPYYKARFGYDSRVNGWTYIRDVKWVGHWPGASMVLLEWNISYPKREFTPEENVARLVYYSTLVDRGYDIPDKYLRNDLALDQVFWAWADALVVRTADGTWKMSQRSFCSWYERHAMIHRDKLMCPDDPTPHFPDSDRYDTGIHPPSHKTYYQENRGNTRSLNYLGVPPS